MKKIFVIILFLLMSACSFSCQKNNNDLNGSETKSKYDSFVCDLANDGLASKAKMEIYWWSPISFKRENAAPDKTAVFQEKEYTGSYYNTYISIGTHNAIDTYHGESEGTSFGLYFDQTTGDFAGIHFELYNKEYDNKPDVMDEEGALEFAKKIASDYISVDEYKIKQTKISNPNLQPDKVFIRYTIEFYKEINGFETSDSLTVTITPKGDLFALNLHDISLFSKRTLPEIDKEELKKSIEQKLRDIYSEQYEYTYEIETQVMTVSPEDDETTVIVSDVRLNLIDSNNTSHRSAILLTTIIK